MNYDKMLGMSAAAIVIGVGAGVYGLYQLWQGHKVEQSKDSMNAIQVKTQEQAEKLKQNSVIEISTKKIGVTKQELIRTDEQYGKVEIAPFSPTWLQDYPQVIDHVESEHILHVKGKDEQEIGLTWHTEKFKTDMEPRLNPEAKVGTSLKGGFQMKVGYFLVPESKMQSYAALALSDGIASDVKVDSITDQTQQFYRFFVHPEAYEHFRSLHDDQEIKYVSSEQSEFIGTPTSSYRSWVVRRVQEGDEGSWVPGKESIPFIVKVGVAGNVLGSDRWLSPNEIERSIQAQVAFDLMPKEHFKKVDGENLFVFPENLGLVLKNVKNYPPQAKFPAITKESGVLIREFPKDFLEGKCKILSLAALMSPERVKKENHGIGNTDLQSDELGLKGLPLIFEVMAATIKAGKVSTPKEFIHKYLIHDYLAAVENVVFQEGLTLEPHSQNLCMVLNNDLTPKGFAYRDHGGIWIDIATRGLQDKDISPFYRAQGDGNKLFKTKGAIAKGYIGSFAWFYRYQVVAKMLNILTQMEEGREYFKIHGSPYQIGSVEKLSERNLQKYVIQKIGEDHSVKDVALNTLQKFSLTMKEYRELIKLLDSSYLDLMNKYFDLEKIQIQLEEGLLPSAEGGSEGETILYKHEGFLGKYRFQQISSNSKRVSIEEIPSEIMHKVQERVITSFENQSFKDLKAKACMITNRGLCFFNEKNNIVAFMPFTYEGEMKWVEKKISEAKDV